MAARTTISSPLSGAGLLGIGVVDKYPSTLSVTVEAVQRPPPEVILTVPRTTNHQPPTTNHQPSPQVILTVPRERVRPALPAGYGSGFEKGAIEAASGMS